MRQSHVLLAIVGLILTGCAEPRGACVTHDLSGGGYWCDDDQLEHTCNAEVGAIVGETDFSLSAGQTCDEIGYGHFCTADEMAASGGPPYLASRLLSNAACDASIPAGETGSGGSGGGGPSGPGCSCETTLQSEGTVHICTGGFEGSVCDGCAPSYPGVFSSTRFCPQSSVVYCCAVSSSAPIYTYMYSDCDDPNCAPGFESACSDANGQLYNGLCPLN